MPEIKPVPVTVNTRGFDYNLSEAAQIATNYGALSDAIADNPGRYAIWAVLEANARKVFDALTAKLEVLDAELFEAIRVPQGDGKLPVVDSIKARIVLTPDRQALMAEVLEAKANLELLLVGRRTIEQKKDSLLALASNARAEMQSRISIGGVVSDRQQRELLDRARGSRGPDTPRNRAR
jgi:hypothetical protein